jgi:hypothetical protein
MKTKIYSDQEIQKAINENLHKYNNDLNAMFEHVCKIANITNFKSGFFGIPFPQLMRYLDAKISS